MSTKVEDRLSLLTVSLIVLAVAVAVAVAVASFYGWQKVDELEDQVTQLGRTVGTLERQLSTANERLDVALQVGAAARSDLTVLASDVQTMQGFAWGSFSRSVSALDDDLGTVEGCLRNIVDIVEGFAQFTAFRCINLLGG